MTQADSVHSTPPTNTSANQPRSSRRGFLVQAAGVAAASAALGAGLPLPAPAATPDPLFAAIERHKDLAKAYDEAWKLRGRCEDFGTLTEEEKARVSELNDLTDAAGLPLGAAAMDLFNTHPTTSAGIITALFYTRIQHRNDGEHMVQGWMEDEDGERYIDWRDAWLETLIQAVLHLDDAAVLS
jgi:hypothetical protein